MTTSKMTIICIDEHNPEMSVWPPALSFYEVPTHLLDGINFHPMGCQMTPELMDATQGADIANISFNNAHGYESGMHWLSKEYKEVTTMDEVGDLDDEALALANLYTFINRAGGCLVFPRYL